MVWRIDRLGRSLLDVLATVHELRRKNIAVQSISDGIDPATTTGRLMLNMLGTLAECERELIVERVNAGLTASRKAGTVFGRPLSDPKVIGEKPEVVWAAREWGLSAADAARLVGWSRATLYRQQAQQASRDSAQSTSSEV